MFIFKPKLTGKTVDGGTKDVEIKVPLKYLSNNCRTFETNLILTLSGKCVSFNDAKTSVFAITDTKLNVLVVTLSTQDNANLPQLISGSKRTVNLNKYQSKVTVQVRDPYLDFLIQVLINWSKFSGRK